VIIGKPEPRWSTGYVERYIYSEKEFDNELAALRYAEAIRRQKEFNNYYTASVEEVTITKEQQEEVEYNKLKKEVEDGIRMKNLYSSLSTETLTKIKDILNDV
jgi:hypothetical protein